ncbi:MAG: hypothetical protein CO150_03615 [Nitrospirae bacterium CG_4_9_14_3_um_filter_53_35]|nr:MAG: hypothetical protein COT35_01695 [Nitrospirae bacterium CG08_land_8_20_14_0_20_52_24]PIV84613.1 MAG: hypothetical protein COW52_06660 [Nitrospirae bacterium CG17_big_fil_post_rev_8_21_14_2_50_50_9]PIW84420.1 MAG: hypothetical protein COZ95_09925 [Nitrospirae bacterium CG_4_8_14_3_um_filter_50_41]PIX85820.1 MAG: hypothetical protein COZ32_06505 [Nitrospirae bacterium CG_4_10_14_3_um_filter_53_41]PJA76253.1 MAG: hypothetical protein CO150_03615 [Nitrospirae bacterium CG_4_9_14_3_um_filter
MKKAAFMKKNCWEYMKCDRGPDEGKAETLGLCPAANEVRLNGVHGGMNAGRACWVVPGTCCDDFGTHDAGTVFKTCTDCDFYKLVKQEEHPKFIFSGVLLKNLMS